MYCREKKGTEGITRGKKGKHTDTAKWGRNIKLDRTWRKNETVRQTVEQRGGRNRETDR